MHTVMYSYFTKSYAQTSDNCKKKKIIIEHAKFQFYEINY